jgi:hypothetical protein
MNWDELTETDSSEVRHCSNCNSHVYFCGTDEETIKHAKAGHCIAREIPVEWELGRIVLGRPNEPIVDNPQQTIAREWFLRERGIDDAIKNADSDRLCPQCNYPAPRWRATCRVCGFEMGRVLTE